ncbi:MAG TPA: CBS domain-containing protein [Dermatophilaceae bacterium]|nr:CBS domain-containing protein [Dermatophilaceae bacterium]
MLTARDLVQQDSGRVRATDTLIQVATKMRDLEVCSVPACDGDDAFYGNVTCQSIVHDCLARGLDPTTMTAADLLHGSSAAVGPTVAVEGGSSPEEVLVAMARYDLDALTVVEHGRLVGVVRQADVVYAVPAMAIGGPGAGAEAQLD